MSRFAPRTHAPAPSAHASAAAPRPTPRRAPVHPLATQTALAEVAAERLTRLSQHTQPFGRAAPPAAPAPVQERAAPGAAQASLTVGPADSPAEREADALGQRFADRLAGRDDGRGVVAQTPSVPALHRQSVTRAPTPAAPSRATPAGAGHALPEPLRAQAEDFFGRGLGHVRVHHDGAADRSARRLDANAYTHGANIVFGAGRYAPHTPAGARLLGHELTHVVQQTAGETQVQRDPRVPNMSPTATFTPRGDDAPSNPLLRYARLFDFLQDETRGDLLRAMIRRESRLRGETTTFSAFSSVSLPVSAFFPGLTLFTRDRIRWELLPTLATMEGLTPGAGETLTAIAQSEALRTYLQDKRDLEVRVELLDPDATAGGPTVLRYTVLHAELTPEQGALRLDSLDAVSIAPLATVVEHATAEARQLARVALVQRQASLAVVLAQDQAEAVDRRPGSVAMRSITALAGAIEALNPQVDRIGGDLTGANADLRDLVNVVAASLHTARAGLATAQTRLRDWQGTLPEQTDEEFWQEVIAEQQQGASASWRAGGANALLSPLYAFNTAFYSGVLSLGTLGTGGRMHLDSVNAQLYRAGEISYDDYRSNGWSNLGLATVLTVVGALSAGLGTELAVGVTGLDAAALQTSLRGMVVLGASQGLTGGVATAISNDVYSSVAASLSISSGTRGYHERNIGGPQSWIDAGTHGMAGGALLAGASGLLGRWMPRASVHATPGAGGPEGAPGAPRMSPLLGRMLDWARALLRRVLQRIDVRYVRSVVEGRTDARAIVRSPGLHIDVQGDAVLVVIEGEEGAVVFNRNGYFVLHTQGGELVRVHSGSWAELTVELPNGRMSTGLNGGVLRTAEGTPIGVGMGPRGGYVLAPTTASRHRGWMWSEGPIRPPGPPAGLPWRAALQQLFSSEPAAALEFVRCLRNNLELAEWMLQRSGPGVVSRLRLEGALVNVAGETRVPPETLANMSGPRLQQLIAVCERPLDPDLNSIAESFEHNPLRIRFRSRVADRVSRWVGDTLRLIGVAPDDSRAAIFRGMTDAQMGELWQVATMSARQEARSQGALWALSQRPSDTRAFSALFQYYARGELAIMRLSILTEIQGRIQAGESQAAVTLAVLGQERASLTSRSTRDLIAQIALRRLQALDPLGSGQTRGAARATDSLTRAFSTLVGERAIREVRVTSAVDAPGLIPELRAAAGGLNFSDELTAAYHAHVHHNELYDPARLHELHAHPAPGTVPLAPGSPNEMAEYLDRARAIIRTGQPSSPRSNPDGSVTITFRATAAGHRGEALVRVYPDGRAQISTYMPSS